MPAYDYRCDECGHITEEINRIADRDTGAPFCPACKGRTHRILSLPAPRNPFCRYDNGYPFFCRATGQTFHSPDERRRYFKREFIGPTGHPYKLIEAG